MNAPHPYTSQVGDFDSLARRSTEPLAQLTQRLQRHTQGEVLVSLADRGRYATDASIYQSLPLAVLVPRSEDDVVSALGICRELNVPIVPRGGGTSQCGQTVGAGLVIDFSKYLRRVIDLNVEQSTVTVEPGLVLDHLNAQLKAHGLWYPVDVSTSGQATLGGMAGNNSCGSRSIAYGNMVHNVLGAEAWLSDGALLSLGRFDQSQGAERQLGERVQQLAHQLRPEIEAHWPKVLRRVAGYNLDIFCNQNVRPYTADGSVNLAHLLIGSEGTLALTRSLTLQLSPLPRAKVLGVVNFPDFHSAMDATQHIVRIGGSHLSAVELVDRTMIDLSLQNPAFAPTIRTALSPHINHGQPAAILLVEFSGESKDPLLPHLRDLVTLMGDLGLPGSVIEMVDDSAQKNLWEVRKAGLNIMMSLRGDGKPVSFIEDCAVPLEHLADYTDALTEVFARHGTKGTWYAHASVGTLHVRPILDMRRDGAVKMRAIANEASELVRQFKGAYSGEHGDGLCRGEWIRWQFGDKIHEAFGQIKQWMDPIGLYSPSRMIDPPKMDDERLFRFPSTYRVIPIETALDWSAWNVTSDPVTETVSAPGTGGDPAQGFAKAVEMCNNNGHCRKFDAGTMCPSYRVTRDEQHLTRGRANTLRLALSGQLGTQALTDPALWDTMELCVSCKGCKRECPTGVDMAKMKIEFTHHYKQHHGYTFKDQLIAHLPRYAGLASKLAPLLNLRNRWPWLARLTERVTGLSAQRALPAWQSTHTFNTPLPGVDIASVMRSERGVVLFVDTFNGYFESDNARAAYRVLEAAGYSVHVAHRPDQHLCCGRTYLATGMVDQARKQVRQLIDYLLPLAQQGIPIVGLEPSCLLTLRDEALQLGLGEAAHTVAKQAWLWEEFLDREHQAGRLESLKTQLTPAQAPFLLHGHCHQKAFDLVSPIQRVLALIPQSSTTLIETSCCGMAGSFGYDAQHQDVSMAMANLSLLPTIEKHPHAWVVADGTSCRHQIDHGSKRQALHVAQVLARHLG